MERHWLGRHGKGPALGGKPCLVRLGHQITMGSKRTRHNGRRSRLVPTFGSNAGHWERAGGLSTSFLLFRNQKGLFEILLPRVEPSLVVIFDLGSIRLD